MSKKKTKVKIDTNHHFLENANRSDSYYRVVVCNYSKDVSVKMMDCFRSITWEFGRPGDKAAKRKIAKMKAFVDDMYNYIHEEGKYANQ